MTLVEDIVTSVILLPALVFLCYGFYGLCTCFWFDYNNCDDCEKNIVKYGYICIAVMFFGLIVSIIVSYVHDLIILFNQLIWNNS